MIPRTHRVRSVASASVTDMRQAAAAASIKNVNNEIE